MLDVSQWEVPAEEIDAARQNAKSHRRRHKIRGRFLRGPVPMMWILEAKKLGVNAYHVGMVGWHLYAMNKWHPFKFTNEIAATYCVDRHAKSRALADLEKTGLVHVDRSDHASPRVMMIYTLDTA